MNFRHDINGLRALAVLAVVLYHFNSDWLPGGFAGVDVFFVISGYLMTGIIFTGIERNRFSILSFYLARAKRIIPALSVVCFTLLVWGVFWLTPIDFKQLGKHVASSMGFVSNIIYLRESGYFDTVSHEKWLLHTWSLSVEWQFYIIYPLLLIAFKRIFGIKPLRATIVVCTVLGFAVSFYLSNTAPNSSFYLIQSRAWEMLLGGVAFLYPVHLKQKSKLILESLGLSMIVFTYFFVSSSDMWPGYLALLPVLGTFFVIWSYNTESRITNGFVLQHVGKASYSIYLWHWPIFVVLSFFELTGVPIIIFGIVSSIIVGFASYYLIEQRLNFKIPKINAISILGYQPVLLVIVLGVSGSFIYLTKGLIVRYTDEQQVKIEKVYEAIGDWAYPSPNATFNGMDIRQLDSESKTTILFIGDSLIEQYYPLAFQMSSNGIAGSIFVTDPGCMPIEGIIKNQSKSCSNFTQLKHFINQSSFDAIVVGGYWSHYLSENSKHSFNFQGNLIPFKSDKGKELLSREISVFFEYLKAQSARVYFILPTPMGPRYNPKSILRNILENKNEYNNGYQRIELERQFSDFYTYINIIAERHKLFLIDPMDYMCEMEQCKVVDERDMPVYKDNIHLRPFYVKGLNILDQVFYSD